MACATTLPDLRIGDGEIEATIPLAFGPRITAFGRLGEPSVLAGAPSITRTTPDGTWRAYGGHRLWAAPERFPQTYALDDAPPQIERRGELAAAVRGSP